MASPSGKGASRWEWRTFGAGLLDIEAKVGLAAYVTPFESDEIYLLNAITPHSAKIRGGVLEVKRLVQTDSNGLELWSPAFKAGFPVSAAVVESAFAALDLRPPATRPGDYELEEFLAEVISRDEALRAVRVKKARRQFAFRKCAAEFVQLHIGAVAQESFCLEDENPSNIIAALLELGLEPHANIRFPKGVERALALSP